MITLNPVKTISLGELVAKLAELKGAQPIGFSALIDAKARKTGNPFAQVLKLSRVSAFTGFDYENSVNRQQVREGATQGNFVANARSWGAVVSPALVELRGEFYLRAKVEKTRKPVYLAKRGAFLMPIARELIAAFLPATRSSAESQGVEKEIVYRNYALRNIVSINFGGNTYRIRQSHGTPR